MGIAPEGWVVYIVPMNASTSGPEGPEPGHDPAQVSIDASWAWACQRLKWSKHARKRPVMTTTTQTQTPYPFHVLCEAVLTFGCTRLPRAYGVAADPWTHDHQWVAWVLSDSERVDGSTCAAILTSVMHPGMYSCLVLREVVQAAWARRQDIPPLALVRLVVTATHMREAWSTDVRSWDVFLSLVMFAAMQFVVVSDFRPHMAMTRSTAIKRLARLLQYMPPQTLGTFITQVQVPCDCGLPFLAWMRFQQLLVAITATVARNDVWTPDTWAALFTAVHARLRAVQRPCTVWAHWTFLGPQEFGKFYTRHPSNAIVQRLVDDLMLLILRDPTCRDLARLLNSAGAQDMLAITSVDVSPMMGTWSDNGAAQAAVHTRVRAMSHRWSLARQAWIVAVARACLLERSGCW